MLAVRSWSRRSRSSCHGLDEVPECCRLMLGLEPVFSGMSGACRPRGRVDVLWLGANWESRDMEAMASVGVRTVGSSTGENSAGGAGGGASGAGGGG